MNKDFKSKVRGFTLTELMIVLAIIGTLTALAVPAYQDYIARTQLTEATYLLTGFQIPVITATGQMGLYTCDNTAGGALNYVMSSGIYVQTVQLSTDYFSYCKALVQFYINNALGNYQMSFTYAISGGNWTCLANLPTSLIPKTCTYSATP
ncbi:MAG: pilin [Methylomonas sp.]|jgi:type IV pilus assembly protein PilA